MKLKQFLPALAAGSALISGGAMAANDGTLGVGYSNVTSTGDLEVSVDVPDLILISDLADLSLTQSGGAGSPYDASDNVCVFRNVSGDYTITASSTNGSGSFVMEDGGGTSTIPYSVSWGGTALTEGTASAVLSNANTTQPNCNSGTGVISLDVSATEADVHGATVLGTHTDTLTLMVEAN